MSRCARACSLSFLACLVVALLRPKRRSGRPPSLVCRANRPCSATPETFVYPDTAEGAVVYGVHGPDLSEAEHEQMISISRKQFETTAGQLRSPSIVHIGPNVLLLQEVELYKRLLSSCRGCRLTFVEPQSGVLEQLKQQVHKHQHFGLLRHRVDFLNAAVCASGSPGLRMYRLDSRICREAARSKSCAAAANRSLMRTSMDKEYVLREVMKFGAREGLPNVTEGKLRSYIENFTVPCFTAPQLLAQLKVLPSDVDFLTVDAEGRDEEILDMFLSLGAFQPAVLKFEWSYGPRGDRLVQIVKTLAQRGYDVHKSQQDLVAMKTRW